VLDLEMLLEAGNDFGKDRSRDQDSGFAHVYRKKMTVISANRGSRMVQDQPM
jgi:hypothetical protein